jgi:dipeptidyl aminopeptidase/acylaminoacyl peptidase
MTKTIGRAKAALLAATMGLIVFSAVGCGNKAPNIVGFTGADVLGARVTLGEPAAGQPKAVLMLIHGGGWQRSDSGYQEQKIAAKTFQQLGYATVTIGYDGGAKGFQQVLAVYRQTRKRWPDLPVCASGISAGANYSLMLATREPDLTCVLALSAPTDLTTIAAQDPDGQEAYHAAVTAFGQNQLAKFSPVRYAKQIKAKVLLVGAVGDPVVPAAQSEELARALPGSQLMILPPGPDRAEFAHYGGVQPGAQNAVIKRDLDFLKSVIPGN